MRGTTCACVLTVVLMVVMMAGHVTAQRTGNDVRTNGGRLQPTPTYLIITPSKVRADMTVQLYVVLFKLYMPQMTLNAAIMKDGEEYASLEETMYSGSTRLLQMKMPSYAGSGNYTLRVRGSTISLGGVIFENETRLEFEAKHVSLFIQTDKYVYNRRQWISFRVMAVKPNLMLVGDGSIVIYAKDPMGRIARRWLNKQLYNGYCEDTFYVDFPVSFGYWTIEVESFGHTYSKQIYIQNLFPTRFDVNLTIPTYVFDNEYAVAGVFNANMSNHMPLKGNATVVCEVIAPKSPEKTTTRKKRFSDWVNPPGEDNKDPLITQTYPSFYSHNTFSFPLDDIRNIVGENLAGTVLNIYATVYDWYFGEEKTSKSTVTIYSSLPRLYFLGGTVRTFKPRQQVDCYIAVYHTDGTKLARRRRQLSIQRITQKLSGDSSSVEEIKLIPDDSIVRYSFMPAEDDDFIRVRVSYEGYSDVWKELTVTRFYAPTNNFISITSSTERPTVDNYMVFTVRITTHVPEVYYQVISGGNIVTVGILFMDYRQKTFSIALSRDMLPEAKVLVFCLLNTGEVLADAINFHVYGIRKNGVRVSINKGEDFSGDILDLVAETDPGSFTFFSGIDYDLYSRGAASFLTEYQIEEDIKGYGAHTNSSFSHTWWDDPMAERRNNVHFSAPTFAIDANTTFAFAGMLIFTDANVVREPESLRCNVSQGFLPCFDGTCFDIEQQCDGHRFCADGADEMGCEDDGKLPQNPRSFEHLGRINFHYDDATWLWHKTYTKPNGRTDIKVQAPSRPATWVIGAIALNRETGMHFSEQLAMIDVTRQFYIQMECPSSAFKGEQLGIQVEVYNYWHQPIEAILRLRSSNDYRFIHVDDFGYVSSYAPRTSHGDVQTMVYLQPNEARYIHFPVIPLNSGTVKITVDADSIVNRQTVTKTVSITYDGVTDHYHTPYFVDLINSGSMIIPDLRIIVPERFIHPNQRYHLYVPGSPKATVSIVGDVMGPGFTSGNLGSYNLLDKAEGQGESYIFDFVIDVVWLRFLKACNQLSDKQLETSLGSVNKDLGIVYSYGKPDGYYVMFRSRSPASIYVTAFALESLAYSIEAEWEYVLFIDRDNLNKVANWLTKQQSSNGAFEEIETWFDRKLVDPLNMTDSKGQPLSLSLTAYVTIALANSKPRLSGDAATSAQSAINLAADYLFSYLQQLWDPFQICIVTYALHLANHRGKGDAFYQMRKVERRGEFVYWSTVEIPKNPYEFIDAVMYLYPRQEQPQEGRAIQGTAYGMLTYLLNNQYTDSFPIMKWLQTQRNRDGSFAGTQDTVVALKALAAFANRDTNRDLYNMLVHIESTGTKNWKQEVQLKKGSYVTYKTFSLPDVYGSVRVRVQGTGYALLQLSVEQNVEYPFLMKKPVKPAFDLVIERMVTSGKNASRIEMTVCAKWLRTDLAPRSGFAMLEADIPTGYVVNKQTLRDAERAGPSYYLWKRSRFSRQKVYLHLDYIPAEKTCFDWHALRWYPVANGTIQHKIRVYEIQEPGNHNTTLYTTYDLFHNHICLVCGSFQCPYCPHYNSATYISPVAITTKMAAVICFLLTYLSTGKVVLHRELWLWLTCCCVCYFSVPAIIMTGCNNLFSLSV